MRCGAPSRALKATPLKSSARSDALRRVACNTPEAAEQRRKAPKAGQLTAQSEGSMHLSTHTGHTHTGTHTPKRRCHMTQRVFCAVQPTAAQNQHAPLAPVQRPRHRQNPSGKCDAKRRRLMSAWRGTLHGGGGCSAPLLTDCVVLVRSVSVSVSVSAKNTHSRDKRAWHASHEGSLAILALFIS